MSGSLEVVRLDPDDASDRGALDAFFESAAQSVVQQTCVWGDVIRRLGGDEPYVLACRRAGRLIGVLPAYRFSGPLGAILASVPQVGPLGGVAAADATAAAEARPPLVTALLAAAGEAGCDLATLVTSPFWPDADDYRRVRAPDFQLENVCQVLDLEEAADDDGRLRAPSPHLRRNLRRLEEGALRIDEDQTGDNLERWYAIHAERQRAIGVAPLPAELFRAALDLAVPRDKARFFFVRLTRSDEMVGGGLYVRHGAVVDALMPSIASEHAGLRASYLLALHSMGWARRRGSRFYNWQGSPPTGGVYRFKMQWGSRDRSYFFLTWITGDARRYLSASVAEIQAGYPWHYVLPFDLLDGDGAPGRGESTRARAWAAQARYEG